MLTRKLTQNLKSNKISRAYCVGSNKIMSEQEQETHIQNLMSKVNRSHELTADNRFADATRILSRALHEWRKNMDASADIVIINPLLQLAELYRSQGLLKETDKTYEEVYLVLKTAIHMSATVTEGEKEEIENDVKMFKVLQASVSIDSGKLLLENEDFEKAQKSLKTGVELLENLGERENLQLFTAYGLLGILYDYIGNYQEAEWYHKQVMLYTPNLEIWQHPQFATSLNTSQDVKYIKNTHIGEAQKEMIEDEKNKLRVSNQAQQEQQQEENEEDEESLTEEQKVEKKLTFIKTTEDMIQAMRTNLSLPEEQAVHPVIVPLLFFLSQSYRSLSRFEDSSRILFSIYDYYTESAQTRPAVIATIAMHLGMLFAEQGEMVKAEHYFKEALDIRSKHLGPNHLHTGLTSFELSFVFFKKHQIENAVFLLRNAIKIFEMNLGNNHYYTQSLKLTMEDFEKTFQSIRDKIEQEERSKGERE